MITKNVCLNYFGQVRNLNTLENTYNNYISVENENSLNIKYFVLYTTWKSESIDGFKQVFPNSFINQIDEPNMEDYKHLTDNFTLDSSSIYRKTLEHYIKGLYVRKTSYETIEKFEIEENVKFDLIISLRTDVYMDKHINNYYDQIINNLDSNIYVASYPRFDIYGAPGFQDVLFIANSYNTKITLDQLSILEKCFIDNTNMFHPETSFCKCVKLLNLNLIDLDFSAFPGRLDRGNPRFPLKPLLALRELCYKYLHLVSK